MPQNQDLTELIADVKEQVLYLQELGVETFDVQLAAPSAERTAGAKSDKAPVPDLRRYFRSSATSRSGRNSFTTPGRFTTRRTSVTFKTQDRQLREATSDQVPSGEKDKEIRTLKDGGRSSGQGSGS